MRIDHVIYGTSDLDAAARRVEEAVGVAAVAGGNHEGLRTHNQIVSLSDGTYIHLLATADPDEARRPPVGAALQAAIDGRDGLVGWAVAVRDLDAVGARLVTPISAITREGMTARLTGVAESLNEPCLRSSPSVRQIRRTSCLGAAPMGSPGSRSQATLGG